MKTAAVIMLVGLFAVAPTMVQEAVAQRVACSAVVLAPHQSVAVQSDTVTAAPAADIQRLRVVGVGVIDIRSGPGARVRIVSRDSARTADSPAGGADEHTQPPRVVRVTIDYVGS